MFRSTVARALTSQRRFPSSPARSLALAYASVRARGRACFSKRITAGGALRPLRRLRFAWGVAYGTSTCVEAAVAVTCGKPVSPGKVGISLVPGFE